MKIALRILWIVLGAFASIALLVTLVVVLARSRHVGGGAVPMEADGLKVGVAMVHLEEGAAIISFVAENTTKTKIVNFFEHQGPDAFEVSVKDEFSNEYAYRLKNYTHPALLGEGTFPTSLRPQSAGHYRIVCQRPIEAAKQLIIKTSPLVVGSGDTYSFTVPISARTITLADAREVSVLYVHERALKEAGAK